MENYQRNTMNEKNGLCIVNNKIQAQDTDVFHRIDVINLNQTFDTKKIYIKRK